MNNLWMLLNLMPLIFNKKPLNYKRCHSIGRLVKLLTRGCVCQKLEWLVLFVQPPCKITWFILSTFQCHTVCAHDKSAPCCGTPDNQTLPRETLSTGPKRTFSTLCPLKNKELHFLLANDALIVQLNKPAPFFPWITKSLIQVCSLLLVVLFLQQCGAPCSVGCFHSAVCPNISQTAATVRYIRKTLPNKRRAQRARKARVWLKSWSTVGYFVQSSLCFHLYRRCLWPFSALAPLKHCLFYHSIHFWLKYLSSKWW